MYPRAQSRCANKRSDKGNRNSCGSATRPLGLRCAANCLLLKLLLPDAADRTIAGFRSAAAPGEEARLAVRGGALFPSGHSYSLYFGENS